MSFRRWEEEWKNWLVKILEGAIRIKMRREEGVFMDMKRWIKARGRSE